MSLIDKILKKEEKKKEIKLQQGVNTVQTVIEESDSQKEASEKAVTAAIEEIQAHPEMPVGEFMKRLQKNTDLTDADLVRIIKQLPDVKSEEATIYAVQATDLSSPKIAEIIEDAPISPNVAQKIVEQIPDEDIQKEQQAKIDKELEEQRIQKALAEEKRIVDTLSSFYAHCENMEDNYLVSEVQQLGITPETLTPNIKDKLLALISRRTALDCMKFGGPKIATLSKIMSLNNDLIDDMFAENLPQLAKDEYEILKTDFDRREKNYHKYDEKQEKFVQEQLLSYIAKRSAQTFDQVGDFSLPKSKRFSNLSAEDRKFFIDRVNDFLPGSLDETSKDILIKQLNGENLKFQTINSKLGKMDGKTKSIAMQKISDVIDSTLDNSKSPAEEKIDEDFDYIKSTIKQLPISQQLVVTKAIRNALTNQKFLKSKSKNDDSIHSLPTDSDEQDQDIEL